MTGKLVRFVIFAGVMGCAIPSTARAQQIHIDMDRALAAAATGTQPPYGRIQAHWHCCSAKGAKIGAAVGAGIGLFIGRYACIERGCPASYVAAVAAFSGVGASIGAFAGAHGGPPVFPIARVRF